jgi:hypothetical protein
MFKQIRTSKATKVIACYLALMIFIQFTQPMAAYALTEGPSQPEFNSFTPIGTSDMVDLASGDFNYNIPIMDVGGYPINLAYNSGVTMDQEASWVGLGWNLNIGQINRNVRGLPDDFKGDVVKTENNLKTNVTVGVNPYLNVQIIGVLDQNSNQGNVLDSIIDIGKIGAGLDVSYNNYTGVNVVPSLGASFQLTKNTSVGMNLTSSVQDGVSFSPYVSFSALSSDKNSESKGFPGTITPSLNYNSRRGLESFNLSTSVSSGLFGTRSGTGSFSFLNNTFTPAKRLAFKNNSFRFSFSTGVDLWGVHGELSIAGYASIQNLADKTVSQKAYGYENTDIGDDKALLDFNREKEISSISKNTLVLPVTNYTYDIYSIQGQGISGTFRPFRGQVGYLYDSKVTDLSASNSIGIEVEGGGGAHFGANARTTNTSSYTGNWATKATPFFKEKLTGNQRDYEKVYFKSIGENRVDSEYSTMLGFLGNNDPITLKLDINKDAINNYRKKIITTNQSNLSNGTTFNNSQIKRSSRELRNQSIQKLTRSEVLKFGLHSLFKVDNVEVGATGLIPNHHTAGYIVTDENGSRHIYGETVYNKLKKEVTFNVGNNQVTHDKGIVAYYSNENSSSNSKGRDHYYNNIQTPNYAHTYLLTSVLSTDYSDLTGNGMTDDDLGNYTKFDYEVKSPNYRWRVPISQASYNEGLKTDKYDQKGSYVYGVKESKYLKRIITKTHIAYIDLLPRKDGYGVKGENGGLGLNNQMFYIKSIRLYSKPEVLANNALDLLNAPNMNLVKPIKTAHFEYDYSLCPNVDNNIGTSEIINGVNVNLQKGKLTLKKVYFTYRNSNMGKYTPYEFNYDGLNPDYHVKAYDIWGNYKPFEAGSWNINSSSNTPQEFPYVDQTDRELQDQYAASWSLTSIKLPSGGKIELEYEADDYQYVQDKKAMQMFKVDGVTNDPSNYSTANLNKKYLYTGSQDSKYIVINISESNQNYSQDQIKRMYTDGLSNEPIYFNFLLNMTKNGDFDYVSGYFEMDGEATVSADKKYLFIPMKKIDREGKTSIQNSFNPISVSGWFFGRQNLNAQVNELDDPAGAVPSQIVNLGKNLVKSMGTLVELYKGPNGRLKDNYNCAREFKPNKSCIRLLEPSGSKIGGGIRVKRVVLKDQWDKMLDIAENSADIDRYAKQYGQTYSYLSNETTQTSSGVATYEPNGCKENPHVIPFYHKPEKLTAQNYQEKPFGESFYPNPTITYSKVTVTNITASSNPSRSGKVVTNHYTSYDFPTRTDFTNLDKSKIYESNENQIIQNMLKGLLGLSVDINTNLTLTQGFVIETNDMNGRLKKQEVYNNSESLISSVEYKYSVNETDNRLLENKLPTIAEDGSTSDSKEIATHFDVYNDFRDSYNKTSSFGVSINTDVIPLGIIPIIFGMGLPERSTHKQILHTAVTTKVIHKTGILKEKIAFDLGSTVYTKNLAWDGKTGQVLLTETINEYDDKYYNFNFPAYWYHKEMGMASENNDITGSFNPSYLTEGGLRYFQILGQGGDISKYLKIGDEIIIRQPNVRRLWVNGYNSSKTAVNLMKANGDKVQSLTFGIGANTTTFKVFRSSKRNLQMASMASVTLMKNPIRDVNGNLKTIKDSFLKTAVMDPKIINSSAIEYAQNWDSQCENGLPEAGLATINEFLFNIKGLWRPVKSYAYLTGRNSSSNSNTRTNGYYTSFTPYYKLNALNEWVKDSQNWTFASQVTKYNPYGVEIENKDALNRYSSAQYGYQYKLPVAVASNSEYREMGFDGFEDYPATNETAPSTLKPHFGFNQQINTNAAITKETSHSGKKSIKITSNNTVVLNRKIKACDSIPGSN